MRLCTDVRVSERLRRECLRVSQGVFVYIDATVLDHLGPVIRI